MMGDFNLPDVSWDLGIVKCPNNTVNNKYVIQQTFLDFFVKHNLSWIVKDSVKTRIRQVLNTIQAST